MQPRLQIVQNLNVSSCPYCPVYDCAYNNFFLKLTKYTHSVSGILWFQDLTLADPYFLLPVITAASIFVNMKLGGDGTTKFDDQPEMLQKLFYGLILVSIPIASQFPMV